MDRGDWIKIQKERHAGGLIKNKKVQKHKKSAKWHGNEEQMNILFTICYDPVVSKLEATQRQR